MITLTPAEIRTRLEPCRDCRTKDGVELSWELIGDHYVTWCGCGRSTDENETLQAAIDEWNAMQMEGAA